MKTLHPKVHGGILARRDLESHVAQLKKHGIQAIDMVVVNLYQFEQVIAKPGTSLSDAIENIDIGGPAMVRAAAKNHATVTVITERGERWNVAPGLLHRIVESGSGSAQNPNVVPLRKG